MEILNYINNGYGFVLWLLTRDHKWIVLLYFALIMVFFFLGGMFVFMICFELLMLVGDVMMFDIYNKMFIMYGVVMVFFFLIFLILVVLGNFLILIMIGAKDLVFSRINFLSWYIYVLGGLFMLIVAFSGGVDMGWTFYMSYSMVVVNSYVIIVALGVFIIGFLLILIGLNFIVTIYWMRVLGLIWFWLSLFVWAHYATSLIMILGISVIVIMVLLVVVERMLYMGIFDPVLGGDLVLF